MKVIDSIPSLQEVLSFPLTDLAHLFSSYKGMNRTLLPIMVKSCPGLAANRACQPTMKCTPIIAFSQTSIGRDPYLRRVL